MEAHATAACGSATDHDYNRTEKTCRYIHHSSFISARFSNDGTHIKTILLHPPANVLLTHPILLLPVLVPPPVSTMLLTTTATTPHG